MKEREIDLLIKNALGESDANESQQAQAMIAGSPEAAREAALWQQLKADFKVLAEVPECQLTSERLRAAVLSGSIKKRSASPFRIWLPAVGLAAAALYAVIILPRPSAPETGGSGVVAMENPAPTIDDLVMQTEPEAEPLAAPEAASTAPEAAPRATAVAKPAPRRTSRPRTSYRTASNAGAKMATAEIAADMILDSVMLPAANTAMADPTAGMSAARTLKAPAPMSAAPAADEENGVVVLSREASSPNGAPVAVEVGRRHDVVFGG